MPASVFYAFRDAPERREALCAALGAPERYRLFGLDEVARRGAVVTHNLDDAPPPAWARNASAGVNRVLYGVGGYGGDFASILASRRRANAADVIFSTVDTVGLPLALLAEAKLVRAPLVYTAIGLPERLAQLRGARVQRLYRNALGSARAIISYASAEAAQLRQWLGLDAPPVHFIPFGVDTNAFRPLPDVKLAIDVVSIGADPRRDFELLLTIAQRMPDVSFHIVASAQNARALGTLPGNVTLEVDVPLETVRRRLAAARVVALPVRDNSYSGATTTLLQAMAMAKPVVVSHTDAIAAGYELEDGENCRLVPPGDVEAFSGAIAETLTGAGADALGARARRTVERSLTWERYTDALWEVLSG